MYLLYSYAYKKICVIADVLRIPGTAFKREIIRGIGNCCIIVCFLCV